MSQVTTLHIKVEPAVAQGLKMLAQRRQQTVAELVRQAIDACYQPDLRTLTDVQRQALEAYRGGYISLGKLAEKVGMTALDVRQWLLDHGIHQNTCFSSGDSENA